METDFCAATRAGAEMELGRPDGERRTEGDRRRSSRGWLEMRARRDGIEVDRRRRARRERWWSRILPALTRREPNI